ncbi:putative Rolling stone [Daphnia magna]|uniref:Putative Rolling stone n=1 Tax=Daphnia magna TaxID=35525 RepID=A0A164SL92_9CRUS|nr:putative Rolling stone [Daphnia magna]
MKRAIQKEFQKSQFNFQHDKPHDFAIYAWQADREKISGFFVFYRFLAAAFFLSVLVANGSISETPTYFFIYLTNLGFIIQTLHLVLSAVVPIEILLQKSNDEDNVKWTFLGRFSWFLYNVTNLISLVISVIYWIALYTPGTGLTAMNFFVHGFNSIMSIGDILVSGRPCRLMHFYQPFVVILAYVAFSAIYWAAGGVNSDGLSYIYPVLNWDNLSLTVPFVTIGMLIILPIVHALLWSLHQLRDYAVRSRMRRKSFSQTGNVGEQNPVFELA